MIRWRANIKGRETIGLGIEAGNVERLIDGKPILVKGESIGIPFDILIHYGATKEIMIEQLKAHGMELPPEKEWKRT